MKTIFKSAQVKIFSFILFFVVIFIISSSMFQVQGPHGGIVKKADNYFIEITNPDKFFFVYLLDKNSKTISNKGISADVKFFLPDSSIFNVQLKPSADDAFTGSGVPEFYACRVTFNVFGKSVSAKFENMASVAKKNN